MLGPIFTSLPPLDYFLNAETHRYALNIVGIVQFTLPGVFDTNPHGGVNWLLWTIPYELKCYVLGALLVGLLRPSRAWLILLIALLWLTLTMKINHGSWNEIAWVGPLQEHLFADIGEGLFLSFFLGYASYGLRHVIPHNAFLAGACVASLLYIALTGWLINEAGALIWLCAAYLTVFIGVSRFSPPAGPRAR